MRLAIGAEAVRHPRAGAGLDLDVDEQSFAALNRQAGKKVRLSPLPFDEKLLIHKGRAGRIQPSGDAGDDQAEEVAEEGAQQGLEQPVVVGWHGAPEERRRTGFRPGVRSTPL
jgi:hypothetical protein